MPDVDERWHISIGLAGMPDQQVTVGLPFHQGLDLAGNVRISRLGQQAAAPIEDSLPTDLRPDKRDLHQYKTLARGKFKICETCFNFQTLTFRIFDLDTI